MGSLGVKIFDWNRWKVFWDKHFLPRLLFLSIIKLRGKCGELLEPSATKTINLSDLIAQGWMEVLSNSIIINLLHAHLKKAFATNTFRRREKVVQKFATNQELFQRRVLKCYRTITIFLLHCVTFLISKRRKKAL